MNMEGIVVGMHCTLGRRGGLIQFHVQYNNNLIDIL